MRRHLSIRWKVLAVLALPVLVIALACGAMAYDALGTGADEAADGCLRRSADPGERGDRSAAGRAPRLRRPSGPDRAAAIDEARRGTDRAMTRLDITLAETGIASGVSGASGVLSRLDSAHFRITEQRRLVDDGASTENVLTAYSTIISADVELPGADGRGAVRSSSRATVRGGDRAGPSQRGSLPDPPDRTGHGPCGRSHAGAAEPARRGDRRPRPRPWSSSQASGSVVDPAVQQQATAAADAVQRVRPRHPAPGEPADRAAREDLDRLRHGTVRRPAPAGGRRHARRRSAGASRRPRPLSSGSRSPPPSPSPWSA